MECYLKKISCITNDFVPLCSCHNNSQSLCRPTPYVYTYAPQKSQSTQGHKMGNTDSIPVVSQVKSLVQVIAGDEEAAKRTQENFIRTGIIASQVCFIILFILFKHLRCYILSYFVIYNLMDNFFPDSRCSIWDNPLIVVRNFLPSHSGFLTLSWVVRATVLQYCFQSNAKIYYSP